MSQTYYASNKNNYRNENTQTVTGFMKYPCVLPSKAMLYTEPLGCIPESFSNLGKILPPYTRECRPKQMQNFNSVMVPRMNNISGTTMSSSMCVPWKSYSNHSEISEPYPGPIFLGGPQNYFADGSSENARQPFQEPDFSAAATRTVELQLRGELHACEEEIKRLKKENSFSLILHSIDLLKEIAGQRSDLAHICSFEGSGCLLWMAGSVLGVPFRSGFQCINKDGDQVQAVLLDPDDLKAAVQEGIAIKNRLFDLFEIKEAVMKKYKTSCEKMRLSENLHQLKEFLAAVETALHNSGSFDACDGASKFNLSYGQLLRAAYAWKARHQECIQKADEAVQSSYDMHVLFANAFKASLQSSSASCHAEEGAFHRDRDGAVKSSNKKGNSPSEEIDGVLDALKRMSWKSKVLQLYGALQAELDHAKKAHIVTEALLACQREAEERVHLIRQVQQILELVSDRLHDTEVDPSVVTEKTLSLLDYVQRSHFDVPSNVKAAVVFDVLKALQELHRQGQVYRWLNPVNIVAQDGFKLRVLSNASKVEPLPPWRFLAPELSLADQTSPLSSTQYESKTKVCVEKKSDFDDVQKMDLAGDKNGEFQAAAANSCGFEPKEEESSVRVFPSVKSVENSKLGYALETAVQKHEIIESACDVFSFGQVVLWLQCLNNSTGLLHETLASSMTAIPVLNSVLSKDMQARPSVDELLELEWFGVKLSPSEGEIVPETDTEAVLRQSNDVSSGHEVPAHDVIVPKNEAQISERKSAVSGLVRSDILGVPIDTTTLRIRLAEEALMKEMEDSDLDDECKVDAFKKNPATSAGELEVFGSVPTYVHDSSTESISSEIEELMHGQHARLFDEALRTRSQGNPFGPSPNTSSSMSKAANLNNEQNDFVSQNLTGRISNTLDGQDLGLISDDRSKSVTENLSKFDFVRSPPDVSCGSTSTESEPLMTHTLCDIGNASSVNYTGNDKKNRFSSLDSHNDTNWTKMYPYFGVNSGIKEVKKEMEIPATVKTVSQVTKHSSPSASGVEDSSETPAMPDYRHLESRENLLTEEANQQRDDFGVRHRNRFSFFELKTLSQDVSSSNVKASHNIGRGKILNSMQGETLVKKRGSDINSRSLTLPSLKNGSAFESYQRIEKNKFSFNENPNEHKLPKKLQRLSVTQLRASKEVLKFSSNDRSSKNKWQLGPFDTTNWTCEDSGINRNSDSKRSTKSNCRSGTLSIVPSMLGQNSSTSSIGIKFSVDSSNIENSNTTNFPDKAQIRNEADLRGTFSSVPFFAMPETSNNVLITSADGNFQKEGPFDHYLSNDQQKISACESDESSLGNFHSLLPTAIKEKVEKTMPAFESSEECSFFEKQLDEPDEILLILDNQQAC